MLKRSIYVVVSLLLLQNLFADRVQLQQVNNNYMALMLGTEGVLPQKATPEQINLMVDGCITAGIIDRLYGFPQKEAVFREQITKFSGYKRLDIQLAYAFYMIGYSAPSYLDLKSLIASVMPLETNFDSEFSSICSRVCPSDVSGIVEYKDRLEEVIRKSSKPLRFDDFIDIREIPGVVSPVASHNADGYRSGSDTPLTTRSRSSVMTLRPKPNAQESALYKKLQELGISSAEIGNLLTDFTENYTEEDVPVASLSSLAFGDEERYYTEAELGGLVPPIANAYRKQKSEGKSPKEIRDKILSIMRKNVEPKYEGK